MKNDWAGLCLSRAYVISCYLLLTVIESEIYLIIWDLRIN